MREPIPKATQLQVWYRDGWHCRYCCEPIFFSPTLKLLESLSPGHGYYDRHGKRGVMVSLFENHCACCDHVRPVASGGLTIMENLVSACFQCNRAKSDGPVPKSQERTRHHPRPADWDGLASLYSKLPGADRSWCRALGRIDAERS